MHNKAGILMAMAMLVAACGDDDGGGPGSLRVQLVAEETITDGLKFGAGEENTRDFDVVYSKYIVAVGRVSIAQSRSGELRSDPTGYIADLQTVGEQGLTMNTFSDIPSGQWDQFGYQTPVAAAGFQKLGTLSDADAQAMIDQGLTYWIEGTVNAPIPVKFVFKVPVASQFSDCENDGEPGVSVSEGGTSTASVTIHGDHIFFDSVVRGDESTVTRRAEWLVKSDKNGDHLVDTEELKTVKAEEVFPSSEGYNLSGGITPIATAFDFVRAQLASQGHLNIEGECVTTPL